MIVAKTLVFGLPAVATIVTLTPPASAPTKTSRVVELLFACIVGILVGLTLASGT